MELRRESRMKRIEMDMPFFQHEVAFREGSNMLILNKELVLDGQDGCSGLAQDGEQSGDSFQLGARWF